MKRTILAGILVVVTGVSGLMAQRGGPPAPQAQPKGPAPKSVGEQTAVQAMMAAQQAMVSTQGPPDNLIAAAEALLTKYADTDFKDIALFVEAMAYQQKGDTDKAQLFAERAVTANPKNFQASLFLAESITQHTRENDLDKEDKLTRAEKYARDAIATLSTAAKPNPQIADQQWEDAKKDITAQAHDTIGMGALTRKKYDAAATEFKAAVEGAAHSEPAYEVRLASAYEGSGKHDEAIAAAEKAMADPQAPTQVKQIAQAIRAGAVVAKQKAAGQGGTPAAPPQIEVKKE